MWGTGSFPRAQREPVFKRCGLQPKLTRPFNQILVHGHEAQPRLMLPGLRLAQDNVTRPSFKNQGKQPITVLGPIRPARL